MCLLWLSRQPDWFDWGCWWEWHMLHLCTLPWHWHGIFKHKRNHIPEEEVGTGLQSGNQFWKVSLIVNGMPFSTLLCSGGWKWEHKSHGITLLLQVASFGCKCFALLFDDIDADMCEADKEIFQSAAHAQVSVTNEVYQHLNQPRFLFCPTGDCCDHLGRVYPLPQIWQPWILHSCICAFAEYCASRALPSVSQSEYLKTIGSKLLPDVDIMWTGPKVISKEITIKSIEEVSQSLQRPPIIWDNIHANDYDQKRLFLGPYDGRSPQLIPYLKGVLTNPNCEFEANYVAMHTLSQWSQSNVGGIKREITSRFIWMEANPIYHNNDFIIVQNVPVV